MDLHQLRCFMTAADELHFGRAAQRLDMMPSALGRHIRLLEDDLGTRLLTRTTALLHDLRTHHPDVTVKLIEDKTIRLLPRLLSGRLDLAFVRPPVSADKRIDFMPLFHETAVVALSERHPLAARKRLTIADIADEPLIVPERRSRPHSHDLTMKLFAAAGRHANVVQIADEKQTIVNLVAAEIGVAIVPRWTQRMAARGVRYVPLKVSEMNRLPLAAAWIRGTRDLMRDDVLKMLQSNLERYKQEA
ncbi:MAG: LysR family transcriptional regulator [Bradyrhizobiaceae bacterium]|nr:MAG: LysR family transcriptional regulator [Bradyrhizobiaceae bacterium]